MGIATQYEGGLKFDGDQMYITTSGGTTLLTLGNTGNATFAGTIGATNFSGSSSGTNTGDQTLPTLSSLGALSTSGGTMTGDLIIGNSTSSSSTQAFGSFDQLRFDNSHSDSARGPNKIVMHESSAWRGGFGIHSDTVSYYSGGKHIWYKSGSSNSFTERMTLDGSGNLSVDGTLSGTNFSGSSSGTNTGDQTLPTLSSLGALSTSGGTMSGTLKVTGSIIHEFDSASGYIAFPKGAYYTTTTGNHTGAIKITIPVHGRDDMLKFVVDIFDYNTGESVTMNIAGYLYQTTGNNEWTNCTVTTLTRRTDRDYTVRFGADGTNNCLWIGEIDSTWTYPQVIVRDFYGGYSMDVDLYDDNWDITFVTEFDTVDETLSDNLPTADWDRIEGKPTIPSGNQIIDWTTDQGSTNIHSGNYINTTYSAATTSAAGLMSSTDKTKLDAIESGADVTDAVNVSAAGGMLKAGSETSTAMKGFEANLSNQDDWVNSPVSILERDNIATASTADKYAPNINFHWRSRVSNSLWMDSAGALHYGSYGSTGVPAGTADATFKAGTLYAGAADITATKVGNWNTAYGWGDHGLSAQDKIDIGNLSGTNTGDQDLSGYLTSLPSHNHDDRYYTETEINTGNFTTSGTWTFNGVVNGLYHSVEEDHYYFDDYNGRRNVNAFLKTQFSDIVKYRAVDNVEYWNGDSWVDGSSQINNVKKLLDGRKDTNWYVPSTYYKFRFTVTASTSWPTMALIGLESSWTGSSYPGCQLLVEELQTDNSWATKVTADFTNSNGVSTWGTMFKADTALHTGRGAQTYSTRITIDFDGWSPSNSSYVTIPLQNIFIYSNFSGLANNDYHNLLNYDRHVTAPTKLFITTTDTNTTSTTALVLNGTEVEKRTLGSNAFNSTTIPSGNAVIDWTADQGSTNIHSGNYTDTNYYLDGITKTDSTNTLVFSVSGATNQSYTFGDNAFTSFSDHSEAGYLTTETYTAHEDTSNLSGVYGSTANGTKIDQITVDANGHITNISTGATGNMTGFFVEDGDGTEVQINNANEWKFVEGTGININWTDTSDGSDTDPYDLTFAIKNNSIGIDQLDVSDGTNGQVLTTNGSGELSFATVTSGTSYGWTLGGTDIESGDEIALGGGLSLSGTGGSYTLTSANDNTVTSVGTSGNEVTGTVTIAASGAASVSQSGNTITIDATDTDTVYTHPTGDGNNHIPTGGAAGQFLKYSSSGTATWATPSYTTNTDTQLSNTEVIGMFTAGTNVTISDEGVISSTDTDTDTVYTHPTTAGNKHIPTGGAAGQFLKYSSSGTAVWATPSYTTNTNTTYSAGSGLDLSSTTFSVEADLRDGITHVGKDANNYVQFDSTNGRIDFYAGGVFVARMESDGDLHIKGDVIAFSDIFS